MKDIKAALKTDYKKPRVALKALVITQATAKGIIFLPLNPAR